jgi:glycosyltransferase involved in cell wall biosynthesis
LCIDGETGFVAPAATVSSVNQALERAWNSRQEWSRLGQAAQSRVEALVPKDPVALFCQRLTACASRSNEAQAGEVLFAQ